MLTESQSSSHIPYVAFLVAAALTACALLVPVGASASCAKTTLDTSTQEVISGGSMPLRGTACAATVRILIGHERHWRILSRVHTRGGGKFVKRVRLDTPASVGVVGLRAVSSHGVSKRVRVHIEHPPKHGTSTQPPSSNEPSAPGSSNPAPSPTPTPEPEPAPPTAPEPTHEPEQAPAPSPEPCPLGATSTSGPIGMTLLDCKLIASDTAFKSNPLPFWGSIQCASASRYSYVESGGDNHPTATGEAQPDSAYRSLTVLNGDNFFGARCELGENSRSGPTAFYHEGQHRVTYFSERLPSNFPIATEKWQTVMQMKQAQPSHDNGSGVALEMEARQNHWVIANDWHTIWEFPASANRWTRFAFDVYYSKNPEKGWIQVSADLNGDGNFNDPGDRSPLIHAATLQTEVAGPFNASDGIAAGEAIPSHLRMGLYHDPSIPCPAPSGCSIGVDSVQVVGP